MEYISEAPAAKLLLILLNVSFLVTVLAVSWMFFLRGRKSAFLFYYLAASFSCVMWFASLILKMNAPDTQIIWLMVFVQYGALISAAYFLMLSGISCYTEKSIPIQTGILLALPGSISILLIITNPLHRSFLIMANELRLQTGLLFAPILALNYTFAITGLIIGCVRIFRSIIRRRFSHYIVVAGVLLPALLSAVSAGSLFRFSIYLSPSLLAVSLLIFGVLALQSHSLNVTHVASRLILNEVSSALVVTRTDGRIVDYNQTLVNMFSQTGELRPLMAVGDLDPQLQPEDGTWQATQKEVWLETNQGNRLFEFSVHPVVSRRQKIAGYVLRLLPLDQDQENRQILARQNEQMKIANNELQRYVEITSELRSIVVRNRLAREMHDLLGHTLIILISVLERMRKASPDEIIKEELIEESRRLIRQARNQLPRADISESKTNSSPVDPAAKNLKKLITQLSQDLSPGGVRLDQDLRGDISLIPQAHYPDLIQICREAITNAIKHGQASTVSLFILADEKHYELIILDNGESKSEYQMGFGLRSMQQRAKSLGGQIRTQGDSSGFGVYLSVSLSESTAPDDA